MFSYLFTETFHVEHSKINFILLVPIVAFILNLLGCKQADPNPEKSDSIYNDLISETGKTEKEIQDSENKIKEMENQKKESDGNNYYHQSKQNFDRINREKLNLTKLKQKKLFYEIKAEERAKYVKKEYVHAFNENKQWPDPNEYSEYLTIKKEARNRGLEWSNSMRIDAYKRKNNYIDPSKKPSGGESSSSKASEE